MTEQEFLAAAKSRYNEINSLNEDLTDLYDYEVKFVKIWKDLGNEVLEKNIGAVSNDKRKKKRMLTTLGHISINNNHSFSKGNNGFQISPRLQELMVYAGQMESYENCNEVIEQFLDVTVSKSQVHRVTECYGEEIGKTVNEDAILTPLKKEEKLYIEADGSMLLTRKEGYKEVKLGRMFKSSDCMEVSENRSWISNSQYVAQFGDHKKFVEQMEHIIDSYSYEQSKIVFITDGALWLKNWIEDAYPCSYAILDYWHACEHLHAFSGVHFSCKEMEKQWVERQKALLLESRVEEVISNIEQLNSSKEEAQNLIAYYRSNKDRMDYKTYQQIGCGIIGSGAIESANRQVIQKRMKQSGQRWSMEGAQHMLNIRVTKCNNQWHKIVALTKKEFRKAA
jgi:DNA-binding transcriptional regulator YhcF (GntR family)